ncbi:dynamin-like GTPase mgm1 [Puccinia graminis f. sp. tritici]|uniref:dynamin GTPase n=1 Tax=Puccinia graminis f. sp. tritici TaxID=56615 RepID=A0A5B0LN66_PUCGR|nr:dynamin-like GTPase mgm1 [Puccinia graminis f. sp. tritici]KAA1130486.1 dynamin-like GTPase mgm1 [Puccinia graminis f. sp. tritici]
MLLRRSITTRPHPHGTSHPLTPSRHGLRPSNSSNLRPNHLSFSPSNQHSFSISRSSIMPHSTRRMISTSQPVSLTRLPGIQVRQMSFISAATRVAARAGGRVVGVGAVGVGGAAYAGSQIDDFKANLIGKVSYTYDQTTETIKDLAGSAGRTIGHISNGANTTYINVSTSIEDGLSDLLSNFRGLMNSNQEEDPKNDRPDGDHLKTGLASLSAIGLAASSDDDRDSPIQKDQATAGLMHLTRKLIEIRSLLMSIDKDESLVLPSIVVIGSQSSGKSSVLEAIVGHEFLPKGNNMVTRRPLELTLVHTPQSASNPNVKDYVECAQFGPGQFDDFREVQRRLTRLNQEVPDSIAVDDQPIHMRVYSPNVPDLSLVDLPGYVQISAMDQPEELRERISQLCDKYIRKPNIILSVCAADVDLANSPALRASKKVDPHGYRTIGVVTKLDLVDPSVGAAILANDKYRLALGYIGVICKPSSSSGSGSSFVENRLLKRNSSGNSTQLALAKAEFDYFRAHADHYDQPNLLLGTETLKSRLMKVLEESMSSSLHDISNRVSLELEEASYQYKVQYNDRNISAETYVAESMDLVKRRLNEFSRMLVKPEVRGLLKHELEQRVMGLLAEIYWSDRRMNELGKLGDSKLGPEGLDQYWVHKLEAAQSRLTKGGIGRSSAELVADEIRTAVGRLLEHPPMTHHVETSEEIREITDDILEGLKARAADHVEIGVMPFRYEIEIDKPGWEVGRIRSIQLVEEEIRMCDQFLKAEKSELKKNWRLREALERIEEDELKMRKLAQIKLSGFHSSPNAQQDLQLLDETEDTRPAPVLLDRARRLRDMESRSEILRLRLLALKSKRCKSSSSSSSSIGLMGGRSSPNDPSSPILQGTSNLATPTFCPEIFLNILADRLASTATDFINIDLLHRFFSTFPHELNSRLGKRLEGTEALAFARENLEVRKQIELQDRKERLEKVMRELVTLAYMKQSHSHNGDSHHDDDGNSSNNNHSKSKRRKLAGQNQHPNGKNYFSNLF